MLLSVCCLTLFLLFCGIGHGNARLMTQSFALPTGQSSLDETSAQTLNATDSTNAYTATTSEPHVSTSMNYLPVSETGATVAQSTQQPSSTTEETGLTTAADLSTKSMSTSGTIVVLATDTTAETQTTTTALSTSETVGPTNATTPLPTNATTVGPTNATTPLPTNATTVGPTNATTPLPTNATTVGPTNATTIAPTPPPTTVPPPPSPTVGDYAIRADPNSSVCLMARMGLQFSFSSVEGKFQTVNLDPKPNVTTISGICGWNGSDSVLILESDKITVQFVFANQMSKFHLSALNLTVDTGSGSLFSATSSNLSLWEASLGSSYMCQKEQSYNITDHLILNTFQLQVQPFNITNNHFSTAHECSVDDTSLLIPIIVGAALAGLILVVVIAYVIGRRKTYVGYQTL